MDRVRPGNEITRTALKELGGVRGVIKRQAEQAIDNVSRRRAAGEIEAFDLDQSLGILFSRLVSLDANNKPARRPAPGLDDPSWTFGSRCLAMELLKQRLLQADNDGGSATIRIAHEALLTNWPRLLGVDQYLCGGIVTSASR